MATCAICGSPIGKDMTHGLKNCVYDLKERLDNAESQLAALEQDDEELGKGVTETRVEEMLDDALENIDYDMCVRDVLRNPTSKMRQALKDVIDSLYEDTPTEVEQLKARIHNLELAIHGQSPPP